VYYAYLTQILNQLTLQAYIHYSLEKMLLIQFVTFII